MLSMPPTRLRLIGSHSRLLGSHLRLLGSHLHSCLRVHQSGVQLLPGVALHLKLGVELLNLLGPLGAFPHTLQSDKQGIPT